MRSGKHTIMKVVFTLLLVYIAASRVVLDPVTMEARPSPKSIDSLLKMISDDLKNQNSTIKKEFDAAEIAYQVSSSKYSTLLQSAEDKETTLRQDLIKFQKELNMLEDKRSALKQIHAPTTEIDKKIGETKQTILSLKKSIKIQAKQTKNLKETTRNVERDFVHAQQRQTERILKLNSKQKKTMKLKELTEMAKVRNAELRLFSDELIDVLVCGDDDERKAVFLMKATTDKNAKKMMKIVQEARDLMEEITTPDPEDFEWNKLSGQVKQIEKELQTSINQKEAQENEIKSVSKSVEDITEECKISAGSMKKNCEERLNQKIEERKLANKKLRNLKGEVILNQNRLDELKSVVSGQVAKKAMEKSKTARTQLGMWLAKCKKQLTDAMKLEGDLKKEEVNGCGRYQRAIIARHEMVEDRIAVLQSRKLRVYRKYVKILKREETAVNNHIKELSHIAKLYEKSALKMAKYEAKGVFSGSERSDLMKQKAHQKRLEASDLSDRVVSMWRAMRKREEKEIEALENDVKTRRKMIKKHADGVMRITSNITLLVMKNELQEIQKDIVMKTEVMTTLSEMVKKMALKAVGKSSIMRHGAINRLVEIKKAKIELKQQVSQLMHKALSGPVKQVTAVKRLMKKLEGRAARLVGEEIMMNQGVKLCEDRESASKRRDEVDRVIYETSKIVKNGIQIINEMRTKEGMYRETMSDAKRLMSKLEIVEEGDREVLSAVIHKLQKRGNKLARRLKAIEEVRRVISGQLVEKKYKLDKLVEKRTNQYKVDHLKLEEAIDKLKQKEDVIVCKGSRKLFEKSISSVKSRMNVVEDEFSDMKESVKKILGEINNAHGKCYNGIVEGIEGDQQKCKVCVKLGEFILRKARNGSTKRQIARMLLARCQASQKQHTCYSAALGLMANFDKKKLNITPLEFCVKANKCVVRDW
ncbi:myosin heavy chain, skeletal muscle, putative [Entamoeba invadens IP1]|uniref:myosin heavy chain, skeletal muscle, putative n=1 Tax=Entamoeba invadens IP1 TaxID=370355 RepID=UPI0002C3F9B1|nr:myosin heavy chain, skeletal muscle, putative [Entamoeba invadens IP1]ELP85058.1 myosin heavy chain, skeletal muscle, putative [Entamoeba invadens IP1]|eukprot:XP_004184404.1 myosin heavy chain, skeletal muscle, putative [Entamoeba invadens IP1]